MTTSEVFRLKNPNLGPDDYLYHLGISAKDSLPQKYGDVKVTGPILSIFL